MSEPSRSSGESSAPFLGPGPTAVVSRLAAPDLTLDVDTTVIESEKKEAAWTYKKVRGYQPMLGYLAENGICLALFDKIGLPLRNNRAWIVSASISIGKSGWRNIG